MRAVEIDGRQIVRVTFRDHDIVDVATLQRIAEMTKAHDIGMTLRGFGQKRVDLFLRMVAVKVESIESRCAREPEHKAPERSLHALCQMCGGDVRGWRDM